MLHHTIATQDKWTLGVRPSPVADEYWTVTRRNTLFNHTTGIQLKVSIILDICKNLCGGPFFVRTHRFLKGRRCYRTLGVLRDTWGVFFRICSYLIQSDINQIQHLTSWHFSTAWHCSQWFCMNLSHLPARLKKSSGSSHSKYVTS